MYKKITRTVIKEYHTQHPLDENYDLHDEDDVNIETTTTVEYPKDTIITDVPFMLNLLAHVRNSSPTDIQLQAAVQKVIDLCNDEEYDKPLSISDLESVVSAALAAASPALSTESVLRPTTLV